MCSRISGTVFWAAISSQRAAMSTPKKQGCVIGGAVMRMWTSRAPARRSISTTRGVVVPRTMLSSTTTTRLAAQDLGQRVELELDADLADALVGHDERAADVAVLHQPFDERDAGLLRVADGGGDGGVGHAHDDVGIDGVLAGELGAHGHADGVEQLAADDAVGPGEVDVLEDAEGAAIALDRAGSCGRRGR